MNRSIQIALALAMGMALTQAHAFGRGFGGGHAGGVGGLGGFHAGGFGGAMGGLDRGAFGGGLGGGLGGYHGGYHGGGIGAGTGIGGNYGGARAGFRPGGFGGQYANELVGGLGGFHGGGYGAGGMGMRGYDTGGFRTYNPGGFGGFGGALSPGSGWIRTGGFGGGLPTGLGGVRAGTFNGVANSRPTAAKLQTADYEPTHSPASAGGDRFSPGRLGGRFEAGRPQQLSRTAHRRCDACVRRRRGSTTPRRNAAGAAAEHPVAAGAGVEKAADAGRGFASVGKDVRSSPTFDRAQALSAHRWFADHPVFTPKWSATHPWAWRPKVYGAAAWADAVWNACSWPDIDTWYGWNDIAAENYEYGNTVVYHGDNVYVDGQPVGTGEQYYQQAASLADANVGAAADSSNTATAPADDSQWLPLGVFGLVRTDQQKPEMIFQLALDKEGAIRGNYYSEVTDKTQSVHGSVDKKTQRAAWTVGDNKEVVVETGLYNLTKDESTALVHLSPERAEKYLLVRIKKPQGKGQDPK